MRLLRRLPLLARRRDVRASAAVGGILILAVVIQGAALFGFVAVESLEEGDRWVEHALEAVRIPVERGLPLPDVVEDMRRSFPAPAPPVRVVAGDGREIRVWGRWPDAERLVPIGPGDDLRSFGDRSFLRAENFLIGGFVLGTGERVEMALPLRHLAGEAIEVRRGLVVLGLVLALTALVVAARATSSAFAPLRRATSLLEDVSAVELSSRLPRTGSGDPVDRHAATLNRVIEEIDDSFARVRAFGSDLTHELRTPINRIGNMAEVALLSNEPQEMARALEAIQSSAAEMSRIVDSLLLLSEIYGDAFELQRSPVDLDATIRRTAEIYAPVFEELGIVLETQTQAGVINGDGTLIDRVLINLLDNALRYSDLGGTVRIGGFRTDGGVVVHVDDSGKGIPSEQRDRIFDRFARLDAARATKGTGLGLALARAVARLHGGELEVGDSPLGGARFVLSLPESSRLGVQRGERRPSARISTMSKLVGPQTASAGETRSP